MDIPDQRQKVGVFVAQYRFEAVLEEPAVSMVPPVVITRVPGEQDLHGEADLGLAGGYEQVDMVGHEGEGVACGCGLLQGDLEAVEE